MEVEFLYMPNNQVVLNEDITDSNGNVVLDCATSYTIESVKFINGVALYTLKGIDGLTLCDSDFKKITNKIYKINTETSTVSLV